MERRDENASLLREYRVPVDLGEDSDARPRLGDPRSADEDRSKGLLLALDLDRRLEARNLTTKRVALDREIDQAEPLAVEHDHPGAGAEDRRRERADRLIEPVQAHQAHHRGRLTARDDQPVEALELLR